MKTVTKQPKKRMTKDKYDAVKSAYEFRNKTLGLHNLCKSMSVSPEKTAKIS